MGKLMNIYFSAKAGSSLLKKTGIIDKITVDKLAAEEQSYIESHNIDKNVDFNYADMVYADNYNTALNTVTTSSVAILYADAVKNGLAEGTMDDVAAVNDYAMHLPPSFDDSTLAEYNKQFDPKVIEAYNKQADEYTKFREEFDSLPDDQKAERMNSDSRYAVMGTCYESDKASASDITNRGFIQEYGMSGVKYLKERKDIDLTDIAVGVRSFVEDKLKSWGVKEETVNKISGFVFGKKADFTASDTYQAGSKLNSVLESRGVDTSYQDEMHKKADEMTTKRVDQAKAAGVYKEDTSASTQKTASNEASMA